MRRILLMVFLAAGVMYAILHYNLWKRNGLGWIQYRRVGDFKANASPLIKFSNVSPFLCKNNFLEVSKRQGSNNFELPYGIKRAETYFQLALSQLENCNVFPEGTSSSSCKKCIVVGNGAVLRNKSLGKKIDSYDVVIRMNSGPVIGYEEDVGRRTTFRLFYPESIFSDPIHYDPDTTAILVAFKSHDIRWLSYLLSGLFLKSNAFWKKPPMKIIYKRNQIRILDPSITKRTAHELLHLPKTFSRQNKRLHPTTGLIAISFAFEICSEVHVTGFGYNLKNPNSYLHYYGNDTLTLMMKNLYHDIAVEQKCLKNLTDHRTVINLTEE